MSADSTVDDLTKQGAKNEADLQKQLQRLERRLTTFRNALDHDGVSSTVTMIAGLVAEEAMDLLKMAAKGEGHADAVRMM